MYNWPLNDSNFTWLDRLKICGFFLNPRNRWTQGERVKEYENAWKRFTNAKYVVMVSSGSTANTLIAQYAWDNRKVGKDTVVFPSVTWQTSVSPWIRCGFRPQFIDINHNDFSIDIGQLRNYLLREAHRVDTVFVTSLIGLTPDIKALELVCSNFGVSLKLDNCENSFGEYLEDFETRHICERFTCSTSNYFGHQTTNGGESGLIFTESEDEFAYYIMNRSHGMVRTLIPYSDQLPALFHEKFRNKDVDAQFDFATLGNNFRNTDIGAFMGLLDMKRVYDYVDIRTQLDNLFYQNIDKLKWIVPKKFENRRHVGFCLPVISAHFNKERAARAKEYCHKNKIEYRPIISGNLLRQTCYKQYADYRSYPMADYLHEFGFYVGLHPKVTERQITEFCKALNSL
jgi:CDP-6-deoxy-D-xylo-4-hexulose-3-dehydrase